MDVLIGSISQNTREELRIHLKKMKGRDFLDIRTYASLRADEEKIPTGKGVSVDPRQWEELKKMLLESEELLKKEPSKS